MYNKGFDDLTLSANLGGNLMYRRYEYLLGETSMGLALPLFYNLKNSIAPASSENLLRRRSINSVFGSFTLGWRSMFYLDGSIRLDQASTLPLENNTYIYPAVTGSFIFSELIKDNYPWLTFGKLRLGYSMVGNDTDPYRVKDTYTHYTNIGAGTSTPGYYAGTTLNNPNLKPERTNSYEAGLEMNFLLNRLGFEVTVYKTETKDQIIPLTVSGTTGYNSTIINAGLISNKGIEFVLNAVPVRTNDFTWTSTLTLASVKNKVEELLEGTDYYRITAAPFRVEIGAIKGEAYGVIMGTDYVYDANGNKTVSATGRYLSTPGNVNIGNIYPDFYGGWNNNFRYKNIDLNVVFDFSKGGHYFSTSYMFGMYSGMLEESAAINENNKNIRDAISEGGGVLLDGVRADGTPNSVRISAVRYGADHYSGPAAQSVFKSDYVKLREINVGYSFPLKRDAFLQSLRVSAYGRNLAVWGPDTKHFDPEMVVSSSGNIQGIEGGAIPSVANYGVNISVNF
jgi:hypothetical protein